MGSHAKTSPRYAEQLHREAGWALKQAAGRQKHLAGVLGVDQSRVSRQCNGLQPSDVSRFYDLVHRMVVEGRTDPGSILVGAMAVAEEAAFTLGEETCRKRALQCLAQESLFEGHENVAEQRLSFALGEDSPDLRRCCEDWIDANLNEAASALNALVYVRALMRHRGWRAEP